MLALILLSFSPSAAFGQVGLGAWIPVAAGFPTTQMGRKSLALARSSFAVTMSSSKSLPIDFTDQSVAQEFIAVDDRIMGGSTRSRVMHADGVTSFEGDLIVEGGGFASVRYSPPLLLPADTKVLMLEARSDSRMGYKVTLQSAAAPDGVSYQFGLPALSGDKFEMLQLPLAEFRATFRGRPFLDAPPLCAADVVGLGLMLSRYEVDGGVKASIAAGSFQLQLRRLTTVENELALNSKRWVQPPARG